MSQDRGKVEEKGENRTKEGTCCQVAHGDQ